MPRYRYHALNADRQPVTGELSAAGFAQAISQLESQGLIVQSIVDAASDISASIGTSSPSSGESPFASQTAADRASAEQADLRLHMEQVIQRGQDLLPPLRAYAAEMPRGRQRRELEAVLRVLERGDAATATTSLAALPGYWIPLLSAASSSHDPGRVLRDFLQESQRAADLSRQWWIALAYPLFLTGIAVLVMAALSFLVIPIFRDIFEGFGLQLPWLTVWLLTVSDWFTSGRIIIIALALVLLAVLLVRGRHLLPAGLRVWFGDHFDPLFGRSTALARLAQFTADLLEAELSPAHALRLAGMATNRGAIKRAAWRVSAELEPRQSQTAGDPPLRRSRRLIPATVVLALRAPLTATARVRVLREISACYADRARLRLSWTRGILEPIAICAIGLIVGVTVLALFMPLFTLIHGLS